MTVLRKPIRKVTARWHLRGDDVEQTVVYFVAQHHDDKACATAWNDHAGSGRAEYDGACAAGDAVTVDAPFWELVNGWPPEEPV